MARAALAGCAAVFALSVFVEANVRVAFNHVAAPAWLRSFSRWLCEVAGDA